MCFVHDDYDWRAQVCETDTPVATQDSECQECRAIIPAGATYHTIYLQQYEECHACYEGECSCPGDDCCQCAEPDFGESDTHIHCADCECFLECVKQAEEDAGCSGSESRPGIGTMIEDIRNGGADEAKRYFKLAVKRHPEMKAYLGRLWREMFVR